MEHALFYGGIHRFQTDHFFFHAVPFGDAVGRTVVGHDGQLQFFGDGDDIFFVYVNHRPNDRDICAAQISARCEGMHAPFKHQAHEKGLQRIVQMMPQSDFVAPQFFSGVVDGAAAHIGAQGAGIAFLAFLVNDAADLCLLQMKGHAQGLAILAY